LSWCAEGSWRPAATECQQRFPQIRAAALDQRDIGQFALSKPIAEMGDKVETRNSAADRGDLVGRMVA
jgi:hypothetical protein